MGMLSSPLIQIVGSCCLVFPLEMIASSPDYSLYRLWTWQWAADGRRYVTNLVSVRHKLGDFLTD